MKFFWGCHCYLSLTFSFSLAPGIMNLGTSQKTICCIFWTGNKQFSYHRNRVQKKIYFLGIWRNRQAGCVDEITMKDLLKTVSSLHHKTPSYHGCPAQVLKGWCSITFRCVFASTQLIQMFLLIFLLVLKLQNGSGLCWIARD